MDKIRILVVDDEQDLRDSIADVLECVPADVEIITAASGEEAVFASTRRIDVAVMDYRMSGLDGLETIQALRDHWPHMGAVLFTAFPCLELAQRSLNEGIVDRLLIKPVDADVLTGAVLAVLREKEEAIVKDQLFVEVARMVGEAIR